MGKGKLPVRHNTNFIPGDVVSLGPDGLPMTVERLDSSGNVRVAWFAGGKLYRGTFEMFRLMKRSTEATRPVVKKRGKYE